MTKTLLITGLLCCFFTAAFTQQETDRHLFDFKKLNQSIDKLQTPDMLKKNPMEKLPDQMIRNGLLFSSTDSLLLSEVPDRLKFTPGHTSLTDNMPVAMPHGHFPSIIIKPDSAVNYMLIIKKP
jgi:hypothetical protein